MTDSASPDLLLTAEDETTIKERHRPVELTASKANPKPVWCATRGSLDAPWPCDAARLLLSFSEVEQRARAALQASPAPEGPTVNPERTVHQHEYAPGGTFELRVMETGHAETAGVPFPPHIVYIDRDAQGRRRTTFVAEVHENAIQHARALAATPSEPEPPALDARWVVAINAHMADFLDQPESFDNPEAIGVNIARHYLATPAPEEAPE